MANRFRIGAVAALLVTAGGCASAPSESGDPGLIQERMTEDQFRAAGLHRLQPGELRALNRWLRFGTVKATDQRAGKARQEDWAEARGNPVSGFGLSPEPPESRELSRIRVQLDEEAFSGWDGKTVFRFKNGQVWKQCRNGTFRISPVDEPMAVIERGTFGGFRLSIDGYNSSIAVCRVE